MEEKAKMWYEEASKSLITYTIKGEKVIFYKAFRLSKSQEDVFNILYIRGEEYRPPNKTEVKVLDELGFIEGCNVLRYRSDVSKIEKHTKRIELLYSRKKKYFKLASQNIEKEKNEKRVRNIDINVDILADEIALYRIRSKQVKIKSSYYE